MINKLMSGLKPRSTSPSAQLTRRLIRREAELGGSLFNSGNPNEQSEFFCLDKNTWVWHQVAIVGGQKQTTTTHYRIKPGAVTKSVNGGQYTALDKHESTRLLAAIEAYERQVVARMYPQTEQ